MKKISEKKTVEAVSALAELILQFGATFRATTYKDGITPESDTDHTVMLALVGCAFAARFVPSLDVGLVAQLCLVHDLVEAYAGDTPTLVIDEIQLKAKQDRESAALEKLERKFGTTLPWIHETIRAYELLATPEARYVKSMDKLMPQLTHILNNNQLLRDHSFSEKSLADYYERQGAEMLISYANDQPEVMALRKALNNLILANY